MCGVVWNHPHQDGATDKWLYQVQARFLALGKALALVLALALATALGMALALDMVQRALVRAW